MHITTDGIVLRERAMHDHDSILTLLTCERGIISAYARGVRKPRSTLRASAELISCSCFVLFCNKGNYSLDKADLTQLFMGVRGDVEKLSLASYFCQLTAEIAPHEEQGGEYLSLLKNTLYLLDQDKRSCAFLKPVYELRLLTMAGYMPNLVACAGCACYESEQMFFLPQTSVIVCKDCVQKYPADQLRMPLTRGVLTAMRHILYADHQKLFAFTLSEPSLKRLGDITENYVMMQTEKRYDTLDFYHQIMAYHQAT